MDFGPFDRLMKLFSVDIFATGNPNEKPVVALEKWSQRNLGVAFRDITSHYTDALWGDFQKQLDFFTKRLKELQQAGQLTEATVQEAMNEAGRVGGISVIENYTKQEALESLRAMCQRRTLTTRQKGILYHVIPIEKIKALMKK